MKVLATDPRYQFPEGDAGRAEIMAFIEQRLDWVRAQMPRMFNTLVDPNMEVKRLPPEEEPGAPGAYGGAGSIDGSIPGPMMVVHVGDYVELTLVNPETNSLAVVMRSRPSACRSRTLRCRSMLSAACGSPIGTARSWICCASGDCPFAPIGRWPRGRRA